VIRKKKNLEKKDKGKEGIRKDEFSLGGGESLKWDRFPSMPAGAREAGSRGKEGLSRGGKLRTEQSPPDHHIIKKKSWVRGGGNVVQDIGGGGIRHGSGRIPERHHAFGFSYSNAQDGEKRKKEVVEKKGD